MINVPGIFSNYCQYANVAYAVDFTNHPIVDHSGFEIRAAQPNEVVIFRGEKRQIPYFSLEAVPQRNIDFWGVNFERNDAVMGGLRQCECMFTPIRGDKPFVLLLEMKYCFPENAGANASDAFSQLKQTLIELEKKGIVNRHEHRIYLNVSIPWSNAEPFENFRETQDEIIRALEEDKIMVMGYNSLLIHTETHIKIPKRQI